MRAIGIVAEYNPFHLGHQYHVRETRRLCPERAVVAVQSGDFVQRGEAAAYDKHTRARAAVAGGVDLVVELPLPWSVASAAAFARGAVGWMGAMGVVDGISFGSECGDPVLLDKMACALDQTETEQAVRMALRSGCSYAAARQMALEKTMGSAAQAIAEPNNILGVEYLRAIKALSLPLRPVTVLRSGAAHDAPADGAVRSASEIRQRMERGLSWEAFVPDAAGAVLSRIPRPNRQLLECAQLSRLRMFTAEQLSGVPDCTEGLENRLYAALQREETLAQVLERVKTKRYALSRLRRMLLCGALGVTGEMSRGVPPYIRVLAADGRGLELLREMRSCASVPVITKPAHGLELPGRAGEVFRLTAAARSFYALAVPGMAPDSDLCTGPHIEKQTAI